MPRLADSGGQANGRFWLPDSDDDTLTGRLDVSRDWPRLEVVGELTPSLRFIESSANGVTAWGPTPMGNERDLVVHGKLLGGYGRVTLIDAQTRLRTSDMFGSLASQVVEGRYALLGGLIDSAQYRFDAARLRLHQLDQWVGLPGLLVEISDDHQVHINYEAPESIRVAVPGLNAVLEFEASWTVPSPTWSGASVGTDTWLVWRAPEGRTVEQLFSDVVAPFTALLSMIFGEECPPLELRVHDPETDRWLEVHSPVVKAEAPTDTGTPLLSFEDFGSEALVTWIEQFADLAPLPQLVAGAATSPGRAVESRLLELAAAAEGLHRRIHRDQRRYTAHEVEEGARFLDALASDADFGSAVTRVLEEGSHPDGQDAATPGIRLRPEIAGMLSHALVQYLWEPSFPQRLAMLLGEVSGVLPGVAGRQNRWKAAVVNARVGFAHSLSSNPAEDDVRKWDVLARSLRWLLTARLFLHAGVHVDSLLSAFERYESYSNFLRGARKSYPRIYDK